MTAPSVFPLSSKFTLEYLLCEDDLDSESVSPCSGLRPSSVGSGHWRPFLSGPRVAVVLFSLCCQESRGSLWLDIFGWRHIQTQWLEMSSPDSVLPASVNRTHETEQMRIRTGWREGALNLYPRPPRPTAAVTLLLVQHSPSLTLFPILTIGYCISLFPQRIY